MESWSVLITGAVLVLMASIVPAIVKLRSAPGVERLRAVEFTPVGKREKCGDSTGFIKWNAIDEVIETKDDFLFSRNERYSILPKRVIPEDQRQSLRDQIAHWRNYPEAATEPIEMYRRLFESSDSAQTWNFELSREDLVAFARSTSIRPINETTFSFEDLQPKSKLPRWFSVLLMALIFKVALVMIMASIPPNKMEWLPAIAFLCFNPLVLLVVMSLWVRRQRVLCVPRFRTQKFQVRLFDGGWAIGNEEVTAFHRWNYRSVFYLAKEFVGIYTDLALIHVMPFRGFPGQDGVWQFLNHAIRLKKNWLEPNSGEAKDTQTAVAVDNDEDAEQSVNPYRSPPVRTR